MLELKCIMGDCDSRFGLYAYENMTSSFRPLTIEDAVAVMAVDVAGAEDFRVTPRASPSCIDACLRDVLRL